MDLPSHQPIPDATAVVLAGGKSSRMGRPKSLLLFDGEPLIVHIVRALKQMFAETVVVAAPDQELPDLPAILVRDEVAYQGPVGGIYYGLKAASGKFCFVTSCDVPFLNPALISHLTSQISRYDVVVPFWEDRFQPLHAVYRTSVLALLKEQLDRGELRPVYLFDKVKTCKIEEDAIRRFDPEGLSFFNMNTPDDYERALQRWSELNFPRARQAMNSSIARWSFSAWPGCSRRQKWLILRCRKRPLSPMSFPRWQKDCRFWSAGLSARKKTSWLAAAPATSTGWISFVIQPPRSRPGIKILILSADAGG